MNIVSPATRTIQTFGQPLSHREGKPAFGVRVADIAALMPDGSTLTGQRRFPTLPVFDEAFAAFAQGTVFKLEEGFAAVEDLQPGDRLMTASGAPEPVTWIGSALLTPADTESRAALTRVMADSFGMNRPEAITGLGPAARLLQTPPDLRNSTVADRLMTPASRFLDGVNVIEVAPPTPVRLFHIGLRRHSAIIANGLLVESYHPGPAPVSHLSQTLQAAFFAVFPHIDDLSDFGPMQFARAPELSDIVEDR